ncbi:hypothetical protein B9H02_01500 [Prosthecochloris sp. HL-130-GSB]|nr:hypothetical protein B9H02_01500 [Prosthecochloris sp. HL-130-GSB]
MEWLKKSKVKSQKAKVKSQKAKGKGQKTGKSEKRHDGRSGGELVFSLQVFSPGWRQTAGCQQYRNL